MQPLLLKRVPLFKGLDDKDLTAIAQHAVSHTHPRNTILVQEGAPPDGMYVIVEGRVKVYVSDEEGKELVMGTMCPGEFFGEIGLFDSEHKRSAFVRAKSKCEIAAANNPAGRFGTVDEFGATCAFMCSVHAGFMTGQQILMDGGAFPGTM